MEGPLTASINSFDCFPLALTKLQVPYSLILYYYILSFTFLGICPAVVSTLLNFVRMFVRAHDENCKQIEFERKKAQKEAAEQEKMKLSTPTKQPRLLVQTPVKSGNIK